MSFSDDDKQLYTLSPQQRIQRVKQGPLINPIKAIDKRERFRLEKIFSSELDTWEGLGVKKLSNVLERCFDLNLNYLSFERLREIINLNFSEMDLDGNGYICFEEFLEVYILLKEHLKVNVVGIPVERAYKLILSIDGGGVRGIAVAQFLMRLEAALEAKVADVFDLFAGVSTGSLVAGLLAGEQLTAQQVVDTYNIPTLERIMPQSYMDKMFDILQTESKYTGVAKTTVCGELFGDTTLGTCPKPFMAITYDITLQKPKTFFTGDSKDAQILLADVVDASSAAPIYYPPKLIGDHWYIDGGAIMNNPGMNALIKGMEHWGKETEIRILSIGTGIKSQPLSGKVGGNNRWGFMTWLKNGLLDFIGDPTPGAEQLDMLLGGKHLRVTGHIVDAGAELDIDNYSAENVEGLKRMGDMWWEEFGDKTLNLITRTFL